VLAKYLWYFMRSSMYSNFIGSLSGGTNINNLNFRELGRLPVPLPPLEEQKRIVAVLDQTFAALDRARAHAEANLADAHELFGAALQAIGKHGSTVQWRKLRLGSIVRRLTNGYVGPIRNVYVDAGVPYLLARHVRNNALNFDGRTYISPEFNEKNKKSKLKAGDVLLVQSGHIGHSAVVTDDHEGHNCHAMIVISSIDEIVSGPYLSMMFNTPIMQEAFQRIRTGSTVPHLTCKMVKELMLDIPPREAQDRIMAQASTLRAQTAFAMKSYEANVSDITALRQSLLEKAFAGELT
jgi:type I restriction enzyme S subunit